MARMSSTSQARTSLLVLCSLQLNFHVIHRLCGYLRVALNARESASTESFASWTGTQWSIARLPAASFVPASVSCVTAKACVTVGITDSETQAERWNGTKWKIEPTPNPR